jgi:hypothetical protein
MASSITLAGDWMLSVGNRRMVVGSGNLGTYTTGGIAITPAQVGLGTIDYFDISQSGGYTFEYIPSSGKMKAYWDSGSAGAVLSEVTNATNLSSTVFQFEVTGR